MGIAAEIRHKHIIQQLGAKGRICVTDVSKELGVTEITIRRDLKALSDKGLLKKSYGGAVPAAPELASELINDGDVIYLEAGSTCYEIIPYLADKKDLTVIVNSLYLMKRLGGLTGLKIIIIGGQYRPGRMDMVGPGAESAISQLSGFKAFTGADDIAIDAGISGADVVTVGFAKLVLTQASEVIFVGDNTKFDNPALYKIADIDQLDYIVTNTRPAERWLQLAKKKNIKLIYPN